MPNEKIDYTATAKPCLCPNVFRKVPVDCTLTCGMREDGEKDCHVSTVQRDFRHLEERK